MLGPKRETATGKKGNEKFYDKYFSQDIIRVFKSKMRWIKHSTTF
jgi:hypothetical protein